jgi:hypothetical protein
MLAVTDFQDHHKSLFVLINHYKRSMEIEGYKRMIVCTSIVLQHLRVDYAYGTRDHSLHMIYSMIARHIVHSRTRTFNVIRGIASRTLVFAYGSCVEMTCLSNKEQSDSDIVHNDNN